MRQSTVSAYLTVFPVRCGFTLQCTNYKYTPSGGLQRMTTWLSGLWLSVSVAENNQCLRARQSWAEKHMLWQHVIYMDGVISDQTKSKSLLPKLNRFSQKIVPWNSTDETTMCQLARLYCFHELNSDSNSLRVLYRQEKGSHKHRLFWILNWTAVISHQRNMQ